MANVQDHGTAASHGQRPPSQPQCGKAAAWKGFVAGGVGGTAGLFVVVSAAPYVVVV